MDDLEQRYQIAEDADPAGVVSVESELLDFATGVSLIDADTQNILTGETLETRVLATAGNCTPVVITNDESRPALVNPINRSQSEVETSLLGVQRSETALVLFDTVNIYGVNSKEWSSSRSYTYDGCDPSFWLNQLDPNGIVYGGGIASHSPSESAVVARTYCPPTSYAPPFDNNTGCFPGGYTDGVATARWESKRAFRYQPGRVTGFTLGVRMSTETNTDGEIIQWGCRNDYGDGYFFQLEKGTDLYIVRTSPDLGTLKVARQDWNGDKLLVGEGLTGWGLDLSRVTMFKIEFSWYGAVGAQFLAYVPDGNGEARWVQLHYISAESLFTVPSLRSAYLRLFTSARSVAGATKPTFIHLYGSSVYIDGGDKGSVILGTAAQETPKNINATPRSLLGLQVKGTINGVSNQKAIYPISMSAFASTPARFDLIFRGFTCGSLQYGYGEGTSLSRGTSAVISGTVTDTNTFTIASGTFPDISAELSGPVTYLSGRRVRLTGTGVFNTHITAIDSGLTEITTDRPLPSGLSSVRLSRMDAWAVGDVTIPSGIVNGSIIFTDGGSYWRVGLWPQASGTYDTSKPVAWFDSSYSTLDISSSTGQVIGERRLAGGCGHGFTVATGVVSTVSAGGSSVSVSGLPWPIAVVAEFMDGGAISDVTIFETNDITTVGSGATKSITTFTTSGISQSATAAGGTDYIAHKFEDALADPLSAVMVDRQGNKAMPIGSRLATFFVGGGETKQFDLTHVFGPDKMFITGPPGTIFNTGGLFVMATARTGSGIASAMLNWEEQ